MLEGGIVGVFDEIKCSVRCGKSLIEEKIAHKKVEITEIKIGEVEMKEGDEEVE